MQKKKPSCGIHEYEHIFNWHILNNSKNFLFAQAIVVQFYTLEIDLDTDYKSFNKRL